MNSYRALLIVIGFSIFALVGCASSATSTKDAVVLPRTIIYSPPQGEAAQFSDRFTQPFKDLGLRVGETDDPDAATLLINFDPDVFHTAFVVSLVKNGSIILRSEASNSGWGTGVARSQALEKLASEVENGLRKELVSMRLSITNDKSLQVVVCNGMTEDTRLSQLKGKINLEFESPPSFAVLTNKNYPNEADVRAIEVLAELQEKCVAKKVEQVMVSGDQNRVDQLLAVFNERQSALAELALGKLNFGDFARKLSAILAAEKQMKSQRDLNATAAIEREKDRAVDKTSQIQQSAQGAAATYKPTFTRCNRVGTQIFCNSF